MSFIKNIRQKLLGSWLQRFFPKQEPLPDVSFSESLQSDYSDPLSRSAKAVATPFVFEKFYPVLLTLIIAFMAADITILNVRSVFLPQSAPPSFGTSTRHNLTRVRSEYSPITNRNLFNSDGIIPNPLSGDETKLAADDGPAVKSSLPLNLIGTIVHLNPGKSVATIQSRSSNDVIPYLPNEEIEGMAYLIKVERRRAIIRNMSNNRLEYIEIPNDVTINFAKKSTSAPVASGAFQREGNDFSITRQDLNNYLKDLPNLLQQATAVPNIVPGSGGEVDGFKMIAIEPDSVFTQIGLQSGDVIKGVNGEKVNSPSKAMELYNALRNEGRIELEIERNGKIESLNFSVQ